MTKELPPKETESVKPQGTPAHYPIIGALIGMAVAWIFRPSFMFMKPSFPEYIQYLFKSGFREEMVSGTSIHLIIGAVIGLVIAMAFSRLINSIQTKS